jgi:hypothetical protein
MAEDKPSWWTTLPGVLSGIAAIIVAITGLLVVLPKMVSNSPPAPNRTVITPPLILVPHPVEKSTLCRFTFGPRKNQQQDYAPMDPIAVGAHCQDGKGSDGIVVAK